MMILLQYYRRIIAISMANYYTPTQDKYRTAKWGFENDQQMTTTYHKSPSINKSTEYGQRSRYKSTAISRLQTARKTIDEVILDISEKKDMNDEALKEIRSVNSEIIEDYRKFVSPFENRENITKSSVSYFPQKSAQPSTNFANSYHQDESFQLRSRLNGELKRNNELIARLERVEKQNEQLRNNQMSFRSGPRDLELQAQNQRLKHQIGQISMIPQQLFNEMQQLKRQNQSLRNDTVRLLKKVERF